MNFALGLLAGGQGSRLGGVQKASLPIHGISCMARVLEQLQSSGTKPDLLLVSANHPRDKALAEKLGAVCIADHDSNPYLNQNYQGPLAGIKRLLQHCAALSIDWLILAPCDAVLLPSQYTKTMLNLADDAGANQAPAQAFVVEYRQQIEPLCTAIHTDTLLNLNTYWQKGGRSPRQWLQQLPAKTVDFSHSEAIWSFNTPAELHAVETLLTKHI